MQKVIDEKMLHKVGGVYALHVLHAFIFLNSLNKPLKPFIFT